MIPEAARAMDMIGQATTGKDTTIAPGVVMRVYNERPALISGYKTVRLLDFIFQPGAKFGGTDPMPAPMACHVVQGTLSVVQNGKTPFTANPMDVWTCDKTTTEQTTNNGQTVAIMRMTWLLT